MNAEDDQSVHPVASGMVRLTQHRDEKFRYSWLSMNKWQRRRFCGRVADQRKFRKRSYTKRGKNGKSESCEREESIDDLYKIFDDLSKDLNVTIEFQRESDFNRVLFGRDKPLQSAAAIRLPREVRAVVFDDAECCADDINVKRVQWKTLASTGYLTQNSIFGHSCSNNVEKCLLQTKKTEYWEQQAYNHWLLVDPQKYFQWLDIYCSYFSSYT
jgi:hypothetical protein